MCMCVCIYIYIYIYIYISADKISALTQAVKIIYAVSAVLLLSLFSWQEVHLFSLRTSLWPHQPETFQKRAPASLQRHVWVKRAQKYGVILMTNVESALHVNGTGLVACSSIAHQRRCSLCLSFHIKARNELQACRNNKYNLVSHKFTWW